MYTLFTFITMKCNTCNKTTTFEPGLYEEPIKPTCKCNEKEVTEVVKKTRKRTKKVSDEN